MVDVGLYNIHNLQKGGFYYTKFVVEEVDGDVHNTLNMLQIFLVSILGILLIILTSNLEKKKLCCRADAKNPPTKFLDCQNRAGAAARSKKKVFWTRLKTTACPPDFENTHCSCILEATYPQIPY